MIKFSEFPASIKSLEENTASVPEEGDDPDRSLMLE
jgi:hypothetical protein